jgi:cytosine/adenosine deaminase-related metal-dependent hydrolase
MGGIRLAAADVLVVSPTHVIPGGAVAWHGDRIVATGSREELRDSYPEARERHWPQKAIFPSFVNAHAHLCLSHLGGRAPYAGDFAAWLQTVLSGYLEWTEEDHANSLRSGLLDSVRSATAATGDILNDWSALPTYEGVMLGGTVFLQVTGFNPVVADVWMANLEQVFDERRGRPKIGELNIGISPHAPYSTSAKLYRDSLEFAERHDLLLTTHLAETVEEELFLNTGTGIYRRMLRERGTWVPRWQPPGCTPVEYLEREGLLTDRCLYAHVNYPTESDMALLAKRQAPVVYCPKSHAFFRHRPHKMDQMIEMGIPVCLGTDSLASNDSLAMLEEVRLASRRFPHVPASAIFEAGTVTGAKALRISDDYGTLEPGHKASFFVADLKRAPDPQRVFDQLVGPEAAIDQVVAWGQDVA